MIAQESKFNNMRFENILQSLGNKFRCSVKMHFSMKNAY